MKIKSVCWIPLTQGAWAQVDLSEAARVVEHNWHLRTREETDIKYAIRHVVRPDGARRNEGLHRFVSDAEAHELIDHENRDGLDNRKENLRRADKSRNAANSRKRAGCTSKFKGVSRHTGAWVAEAWFNQKKRYLGRFDSEEEAARAYDSAATETFGEFARLNFPK